MVRVGRVHLDLLIFSIIFSIIFCLCCVVVDKLLGFWVFLELAGLSIVPSFFYGVDSRFGTFYNSLLTYIVMSSLASVLIFTGLIFIKLYFFVFLGFVIKFGLFPFSFWVYKVFMGRNWLFIFFLRVVMKFPILIFCFLLQGLDSLYVCLDRFVTIMLCTFLFWFFRFSWEFIWGHISIVSVSTLLVACFCRDSGISFFIYFYYFVWGRLCILYFLKFDALNGKFWFYFFLILVTPLSLPLFYKFSVRLAIINSYTFLLVIWCFYKFSEQFFLYKLAGDKIYSDVKKVWSE